MRRRLAHVAPEMSHWFGIHPFDADRLTHTEASRYLVRLAELSKMGE